MIQGIVIIGGGGHAKVLVSTLKKLSREILGYTDLQNCGEMLGASYLGDDSRLVHLLRARITSQAALGVGKVNASRARLKIYDRVEDLGFSFPAIVSPTAVANEGVAFGPGTVVFDGAVVNSGTITGRACILNTSSTVEHDCEIADNVHVAPGAVVSGGVVIGSNVMIGAGATVVQNRVIADGCVIGAGSTVIKDLQVSGAYAGTPARRIG